MDPLGTFDKGKTPSQVFSFDLKTEHAFNKEDINIKVLDLLQTILNQRFSNHIKREIAPKHDRYNFACPYCGDSVKTAWKKRGNLYLDSYAFHCYNCGKHTSFNNMAIDFNSNVEQSELLYIKRVYEDSIENNTVTIISNDIFFDTDIIEKFSVSRELFLSKMGLVEIKNSLIEKYLINRLQNDWINFAWNSKEQKLAIFNLTKDGKNIIGMQWRNFKSTPKYLTYDLESIYKLLGMDIPINNADFKYLNKLSTFFNILRIDINKPITGFEGPMDSFLYPNSIAMCSVNTELPMDIPIRWFYDADPAGRKKSLEKLQNNEEVFLWKKFIREADIGINANTKMDLNKLLIYIKENGYKIPHIKNYFSNNKYDAIWI